MQRREQPRLGLRGVAQLVPLLGPYVECLLRQITRLGLASRQTEREAVEVHVVLFDQAFEVGSDIQLWLHGWEQWGREMFSE